MVGQASPESIFPPEQRRLRQVVLAAMLLVAFLVRLYGIASPPLDFHPVRQYLSALIARRYYDELRSVDPSAEDKTAGEWVDVNFREPPIIEGVSAVLYLAAGGEQLWLPRLFSAIVWVLGGLVVYQLAGDLFNHDAGLISAAAFLFLPYGIAASRSIQPDPMMVVLLLVAVWLLAATPDRPLPWWKILAAGAAAALSILIKPYAALMIFGAVLALRLSQGGIRSLIEPRVMVFAALSILPAAGYYGYGLMALPDLRGQLSLRFVPALLTQKVFWDGWFQMIGRATGYAPFVIALLSFPILRDRRPLAVLLGLWLGYILYGLMFTYNVYTHDYYHLPLVAIVALTIGPVGALLVSTFVQPYKTMRLRAVFLVATVVVLASASLVTVKQAVDYRIYETADPAIPGYAPQIGDLVHHSIHTVFLSPAYGLPLAYYGKLGGIAWPDQGLLDAYRWQGLPDLSAEQRFQQMVGPDAEYFIVTDFGQWAAQPDLRAYLDKHTPVLASTDQYLIFDLRQARSQP
jgi:4-amino-4-deoxy-L-arabinose transferase-like glycosyltransferase